MNTIFEQLTGLLKTDERLVSQDGLLLKNKAQELTRKNDPDLIKMLFSDEAFKQHFFFEVSGVTLFDKEKFIRFVSNKQFLPDSYTAFKNKIGFMTGEDYFSERKEVVLVWPYKDCILEGGMTKEDQKRDEIFYNETLAPDDVTRLLDPKVFAKFKRIDKDGEHSPCLPREGGDPGFRCNDKGTITDNLIIKGNNLLAISALKQQFAGKVKLIYIDPPYNTGNDGFGYNDSFNHSSWLTFMKNRLEIARTLLSENGSIWINIDDDESHYLKVLCDGIFGRENFVANVIWEKKYSPQNDVKWLSDSHDHILVYAKKKDTWRPNLLPRGEKQNVYYKYDDNDGRGLWRSDNVLVKTFSKSGVFAIVNPNTSKEYFPPSGSCYRFNAKTAKRYLAENRFYFGKDGKGAPQLKRYLSEVKDGVTVKTIWTRDEVGDNQESKKEIDELEFDDIFSTPKPERLLQRIIHLGSKENDLVLDFFAGSGTTCAVAHKMHRQYIGIEQMDYIHDLPEARLKKVIAGEQGGISKAVEWQGGGEFVYMELRRWNEIWMEKIQAVKTTQDAQAIWNEIKTSIFLNWRIDPKEVDINAKDFTDLTLADQQKFLIQCTDKNELYVNLSEIEDVDYEVSAEDKKLNYEFYGK